MTVSVSTSSQTYNGDGATTIFPTVFVFNTAADIEVIERVIATGAETTLVNPTNYSVTGGGGPDGIPTAGNVVAVVAPPATVTWTLNRIVAEVQETALPQAGELPSKSLEGMDDRQVMMIQQHSTELAKTLKYPVTDPLVGTELPNSVDRANKYLAFGNSGEVVVLDGTTGFQPGTEAAPGVAPIGDTDTGFYWPAANELAVTLGGSEAARWVNGRYGVGVTAPDGTIHAGNGPEWGGNNYGINLYLSGARNNAIGIASSGDLTFWGIVNTVASLDFAEMPAPGDTVTNPLRRLRLHIDGNVQVGAGTTLATAATDGFLIIPAMNGDATGTPNDTGAGGVALAYDNTNNELKVYANGAWRTVATVAQ